MATQSPGENATTQADDGTTTPDPTPLPPTPTTTRYRQIADDFMRGFEVLAATIPKQEPPHASTLGFVRAHTNVSVKFLATVTAGVEQFPALQGVKKLDVVDARDKLQYIEAVIPLIDRVERFVGTLRFSMNAQRALLAADALQVYAIAQAIARDPGSGAIGQAVADMKRDLGRRGRSKKKAVASPASTPPAPSPAPPAPTPQKGAGG